MTSRELECELRRACWQVLLCGGLLLLALAGCALHFHYHGTAAPPRIEIGNSNDNASADGVLRDILGVE